MLDVAKSAVPSTTDATELAKIICEACWSHFRSWNAWSGMKVHNDASLTWTEAPIPHSVFNQVYGARFRSDETHRRISTIVTGARQRGMPVIWRVGPDSSPRDLGRRLEEAGFKYADDALAMAVDLSSFDLEEEAPPHLVIEPVRDDAMLREWTAVAAHGFGFPEFVADPLFEILTR